MTCSISPVNDDSVSPVAHGEVSLGIWEVVDPKAEVSDLDVARRRGNSIRCAKSPAEGIPIGARARVKRSIAPEDLQGLPVAMADREVVAIHLRDAPVGADLDRVIADGDPIRCAQCRASDERVPTIKIVVRVMRSVASEDLRGVPAAMADREVVVVHCCNPPVGANLDLTVAN